MARTQGTGSNPLPVPARRTWYLKLQSPRPAHNVTRSLRTNDKLEADALAADLIAAHKRHLLERSRVRLVCRQPS